MSPANFVDVAMALDWEIKNIVKKMKAVIFSNGFRKRFIEETGGLEGLESLFDFFIDTSIYMKPWEHKRGFDDVIEHKKKITVNDENELKKFLQSNKIKYVLFVGLEWSENRYETLKKIEEAEINWGILFIRGAQRNLFNGRKYDPYKYSENLNKQSFKLLIKGIFKKVSTIDVTPTHYISNEIKAIEFPEVKKETKKVLVNHKDYYLANSFEKPVIENYIVFLDQAFPFHFSNHHGLPGKVEYYDKDLKEQYYQSLNEYLSHLSFTMSKKVVVCLHPNCPDDYKQYFFNDFKVVKYQTGKYARHADLLVTHDSTSISMGYMFGIKSVMLILKNDMHDSIIQRIRKKSEIEKVTLHEWPNKQVDLDEITVPDNPLIKNFYVPKPSSISMIDELKKELG